MPVLDFPRTAPPALEHLRLGSINPDAEDPDTAFALIQSMTLPVPVPGMSAAVPDEIGFDPANAHARSGATPGADWLGARESTVLGYLGLLQLERGRLRAAQVVADVGLEMARHQDRAAPAQAIVSRLVLALVLVERNRLGEAQRQLDAGLSAQRDNPMSLVALHVAKAKLLLAGGHVDRARAVLTQQGVAAGGWEPATLTRQWRLVVEAEIDLATGRPSSALDRLRPLLPMTGGTAERASVVRARAELANGHVAGVETILAPLRAGSGNPVVRVEAWLVTALAADHRGDDGGARTALERALTIAEPEGIRRPFLAPGHPRLAAMRLRRRLTGVSRGHFAEDVRANPGLPDRACVPSPLTPLTDRERTILRHLATLETAEDIAAELYISVNTVKTHVRSVYRKLAVTKRRAAVRRACELGLL